MIPIINFGSQFVHLIARRVRELGVYTEILNPETPIEKIKELNPNGIILSGGPSSVYEEGAPDIDPELLNLGVPVLGICYGLQLIAKHTNAKVQPGVHKEYGKKTLHVQNQGTILKGLANEEQIWMSHGDLVEELPEGFGLLATTDSTPIGAFESNEKKIYGVQFHPEVVHTTNGKTIIKNFVQDICKAPQEWNLADRVPTLIEEIKQHVGESSVIMGVSGGVDSTVAATLIHNAIGERIHCVFVDHGLIRKFEADEVKNVFEKELSFEHFHYVDASNTFLEKLKGVTDPEEKRKIIGHTFIEVFEKQVVEIEKHHPEISFLGQGTIYPDRIESAEPSKHASKIKSHHNLTLPDDMKLDLVEPLKEFYKDEVREIGKQLGISQNLLDRHPFPGPGIAIRILGEITQEKIQIVQDADFIFIEELKESGYYEKTWQAFAALFDVKAVGVKGDARTYEYIVSLRAVTSIDAMTADWARLPHELLEKISTRILNEVRGVNRVVYDISQKPPGTIEYE